MTTPFETNHANPWTTELVDLEELNAGASDAMTAAIKRVRDSAKGERARELTQSSQTVPEYMDPSGLRPARR